MKKLTDYLVKCELKEDIPKEIFEILNFLFFEGSSPKNLPTHNFFIFGDWHLIGFDSTKSNFSRLKTNYFFHRGIVDNKNLKIEEFFAWLKPYMKQQKGDCIGYIWYEDWQQPELYLY